MQTETGHERKMLYGRDRDRETDEEDKKKKKSVQLLQFSCLTPCKKNAVISTLPDNGVPTGFPLDKSFITSQYYVLQTVANR